MKVNLSSKDWESEGGTSARGAAFIGDQYHSSSELVELVSDLHDIKDLCKQLQEFNGFFTIIHRGGDVVYMASDHIRSYPLYYAVDDDLYISDSAEWIHDEIQHTKYDSYSATEYLFSCYVTGDRTLSKSVKQLNSGEIVKIDLSDHSISKDHHYNHNTNTFSGGSSADFDVLDEVLVSSINRLIKYANGRTILLGLSGGYDSKIIARLLSRVDYNNVLSYTYGPPLGSPNDVSQAKELSDRLGYPHVELKINKSDYDSFRGSDEWKDFITSVGYLSRTPTISQYIILNKISKLEVVPDDAVVVQGHQAFGPGSLLPNSTTNKPYITKDEFLELIYDIQYKNWSTDKKELKTYLKENILETLNVPAYNQRTVEPAPSAWAGFDNWYWQERVPKYLLDSREIDYMGFDYWYPLLDKKLYLFMKKVGHEDKVGKKIAKKYEDGPNNLTGPQDGLGQKVKSVLSNRSEPVKRFAKVTYKAYNWSVGDEMKQERYGDHPGYSIFSRGEFERLNLKQTHQGSLLALYLYKEGYFDLKKDTEFDQALVNKN